MSEEVFYILKLKRDLYSVIDNGYYELRNKKFQDYNIFKEMQNHEKFPLLIFMFDTSGDNYRANEIFICQEGSTDEDGVKIGNYIRVTSPLKVANFTSKLNINLKDDFDYRNYLSKETAIDLFNDFLDEVNYAENAKNRKKEENVEENYNKSLNRPLYHMYLAEDIKTDKVPNFSRPISYENKTKEDTQVKDNRSPFERDRDRIIHSKAFRRLVDKAQIFTSSKGDHYRTRMTHTLEVAQIARSIARRLQLDENLTEAIALGHDLGHTPFGHQGERTLDEILKGDIKIIHQINEYADLKQRFKHNFQTLRVLTLLENKYLEYEGLNLNYLTMEGMLKHTKIHDGEKGNLDYEVKEFFNYPHEDFLYLDCTDSITLEGQIVAIADEIAQRSHDIDDAFKSGKITHKTFMKYCYFCTKDELKTIDQEIEDDITENSIGNMFIDTDDLYRAQLCSKIISFFISDVVKNYQCKKESNEEFLKNGIWTKKVIDFSDKASRVNIMLDKMIKQLVLSSSEVSRFDQTASNIVTQLFEYYYSNPLSLEDGTLRRLFKEMSKQTDNCISFRGSDIKLVRQEIQNIIRGDLNTLGDEYLMKRRLLVRCIADHISGMTDSYAMDEYKKIKGII